MSTTEFLLNKAKELNYSIRSMGDLVIFQELIGYSPQHDSAIQEPPESEITLNDIYHLINENQRKMVAKIERSGSEPSRKLLEELHKVHFPDNLPKSNIDHKQDFIAKILLESKKRTK